MDESQKRSLLIIAVVATAGLLGYYFLFPPEQPQPHAPVATPAGPAAPTPNSGGSRLGAPPALTDAQLLNRIRTQRTATIDTPQFHATFTNLNAALVHYQLKGARFTEVDPAHPNNIFGQGGVRIPIDLVSTTQERYFPLRLDLGGVPIPADALWEIEQLSPTAVRFTWSGGGFAVARKIEAGTGPFQLWSTVRVTNTSSGTRPVRANVFSYHYVVHDDEGGGFLGARSPKISQGLCVAEGGTKRFARADLLTKHTYHRAAFAGTENTYFATLLATDRGTADFCTLVSLGKGGTASDPIGSLFEARLAYPREQLAPGASTVVRTLVYAGPKDGELLARAGHQLSDSVDLGFFSIIARAMVKLLGFIHGFLGNWGAAIIFMTVCVKLVLFPLTLAQLRSMAKMRQLKPELDKLNEQYGDDREKKGAATMELYRRHGVNPVAGCLPTLAQLPVWWALYTSLSTNIALFNAPFLPVWLTDLSSPDPIYVMPLALGALMWVQQRMTPTTMDPMQAKIMQWMMPIMITVFMLFLPQGLTLYMFTNSALGIAQQRYIEYRLAKTTAAAAAAPVVVNAGATPFEAAGASGSKAGGSGGKKSGKSGSARRSGRG